MSLWSSLCFMPSHNALCRGTCLLPSGHREQGCMLHGSGCSVSSYEKHKMQFWCSCWLLFAPLDVPGNGLPGEAPTWWIFLPQFALPSAGCWQSCRVLAGGDAETMLRAMFWSWYTERGKTTNRPLEKLFNWRNVFVGKEELGGFLLKWLHYHSSVCFTIQVNTHVKCCQKVNFGTKYLRRWRAKLCSSMLLCLQYPMRNTE